MEQLQEGRGDHTFRYFSTISFPRFLNLTFLMGQDLSSLRLLLPSAQKHLIAAPDDHLASSLAKLKVTPILPKHLIIQWHVSLQVERDQTNTAIKQQMSAGASLPGSDQQPKVVQVNQPVSRPLLFSLFIFLISFLALFTTLFLPSTSTKHS